MNKESLNERKELIGAAIQRAYSRLGAGSPETKQNVLNLISYLEIQYRTIEDAIFYHCHEYPTDHPGDWCEN